MKVWDQLLDSGSGNCNINAKVLSECLLVQIIWKFNFCGLEI